MKEYHQKVNQLLPDTNACEELRCVPTRKYKSGLINKLRKWQEQDNSSQGLYKELYPTTANVPKFYGLPQIHKTNTPLRQIV